MRDIDAALCARAIACLVRDREGDVVLATRAVHMGWVFLGRECFLHAIPEVPPPTRDAVFSLEHTGRVFGLIFEGNRKRAARLLAAEPGCRWLWRGCGRPIFFCHHGGHVPTNANAKHTHQCTSWLSSHSTTHEHTMMNMCSGLYYCYIILYIKMYNTDTAGGSRRR